MDSSILKILPASVAVASVIRCGSVLMGACGMLLHSYCSHSSGLDVLYELSRR